MIELLESNCKSKPAYVYRKSRRRIECVISSKILNFSESNAYEIKRKYSRVIRDRLSSATNWNNYDNQATLRQQYRYLVRERS